MDYLVTGGAGFIGAHISTMLIRLGHRVTIIDDLSTGLQSNIPTGARFIEGDVSKKDSINKLNNEKFDAILHIAGQSSGEISFEDPISDLRCNTNSTLQLLEYARRTGCSRFIYASTMSVYGESPGKEQFSESDQPNPKSFYAVGKLASENYLRIYAQQYGINVTSLRYFNVYGPGQNLTNLKQGLASIFLKQFIDPAFENVLVKGSTDRFRDLSYVTDIANITVDAIQNEGFFNEIVNVGSGLKTTVQTVLDVTKRLVGSKKEIIITDSTPGDQFGIYADTRKLKSIYSAPFTSFEEGMRMMVAWAKDT